MSDIQGLVESLADTVGRPVTLEDRTFRLIAHGGPPLPMDDVRLSSVLGRRAVPWVVEHFEALGIAGSTGVLRLDAVPERGILARWCVAVRHRDHLLAYLWVLVGEEELPGGVATLVERAATELGLVLDGERFSRRLATQLLRQLLSSAGAADAAEIERELHADGTWAHRGPAAVVIAASTEVQSASGRNVPEALGEALVEVSHTLPQATTLLVARPDEAVLVVGVRDRDGGGAATMRAVAERFRERAERHLGHPPVIAIGDVVGNLAGARESLRQAHLALRVGLALPGLGPVVAWPELGVFRALALVPPDDIVPLALDHRVRLLIETGDVALAGTAETYLDLAGDAQATAAALHIHRATLYHRLDRLRATTGLDLRRGEDRLIVHLGVKLARLRR